MYRIKEEIKHITLYDQPETQEALYLLNKNKEKISLIKNTITIFTILLFATFIISLITRNSEIFIISGILFLIMFIFFIIVSLYQKRLLEPYYSLLRIAKRNDQIRHEERIRFRERKRLEAEEIEIIYKDGQSSLVKDDIYINKKQKTLEDIDNTLEQLKLNNQSSKKKLPPKPNKN